MVSSSSLFSIFWWAGFTICGIWAQRFVPGVDFLAAGLIISMQEQGRARTLALTVIWILLQEGMGNLPFGYGLAWYGSLAIFYAIGRWLFEARSILFMCLLGAGLGAFHPVLASGLAQLAKMTVPFDAMVIEGVIQAVTFPVIWLLANTLYPRRLRQDVRSL